MVACGGRGREARGFSVRGPASSCLGAIGGKPAGKKENPERFMERH